jgi:hypothetical protein
MSPSCHPRPAPPERAKREPGLPAGFWPRPTRRSGTARGSRTGPGRYRSTRWDPCCGVMERPRRRCRRRVRAPAPGRGAAVVAATRPIPRRDRAGSRARGVPVGPPAAALDPGRAARAGVHAAPRAAGARPADRELPAQGDSAGIGLSCGVLARGWCRPRSWRPVPRRIVGISITERLVRDYPDEPSGAQPRATHSPPRGSGAATPQGALRAIDSTVRPRSWRTFGPRRLRRQSDADRIATERGRSEAGAVGASGRSCGRRGGGGDYRVRVGWLGALPRLDRPAGMTASQARDHPQQMRTLAWLETTVASRRTRVRQHRSWLLQGR